MPRGRRAAAGIDRRPCGEGSTALPSRSGTTSAVWTALPRDHKRPAWRGVRSGPDLGPTVADGPHCGHDRGLHRRRCPHSHRKARWRTRTRPPRRPGAASITALLERTGVDPDAVEDVIFGNVDSVGGQAGDIARPAGWRPAAAARSRHNRRPPVGSGQQAVSFAAMGVMAGVHDLVVAGGVQQMSQIPISPP